MKMTKKLETLMGAIALPHKFNLTAESDKLASGEINNVPVRVIQTRKGKFTVLVGTLPGIELAAEEQVNSLLTIVSGRYDR